MYAALGCFSLVVGDDFIHIFQKPNFALSSRGVQDDLCIRNKLYQCWVLLSLLLCK